MTIKRRIYELVEKGSHGKKYNLYFDYFIASLIILNVLAIAVDSLSSISAELRHGLKIFEIISLIIFTVEYLMRIYVADLSHPVDSKTRAISRFVFSPLGLIDLFSILPFYLPFLFPMDLRFLRLLRLLRFMRVFKITHYNQSLTLIGNVIKEKKAELGTTFFVAFILIVVAAFLMYFVEGKVQPDKFTDVFDSFWWALGTLSTVGYGDIYPITTFGKAISAIVSVLGIGIVALPTGIISSSFIAKVNKSRLPNNQTTCPHCGKEI